MVGVLQGNWALFLGILLLQLGNGLIASLLGVRSVIEGFSPEAFGYVSGAYFIGFFGGSMLTPMLLRRVGHIRVFAALASLISAAFIGFAAIVEPWAWVVMRFVVGFCFSGVYIVAESWISDGSTNENRGQALSLYMITQYLGIMFGTQILQLGDPAGYGLFVLISVLVSISFAPILLSVSPAPLFETGRPMTLREVFVASPLGFVGSLLLGGCFGAIFGMGALYGSLVGLTVPEVATFMTAIFGGALLFQFPLGWLSDRLDRRRLIIAVGAVGVVVCMMGYGVGEVVVGELWGAPVYVLYLAGLLVGGCVNPLYSLILAHTSDFLEREDMASAVGTLVLLNGAGAFTGPIVLGYMMSWGDYAAFWAFQGAMLVSIAAYGVYRATQRAALPAEETGPYTAVGFKPTAISLTMAQEHAYEQQESDQETAAVAADDATPASDPAPEAADGAAEGSAAEASEAADDAAHWEPAEWAPVVNFWLWEVGRQGWYRADDAVDAAIRERFGDQAAAAARGELSHWEENAEGALALLVLLDQFPRNLHRESARAFAHDLQALSVAERAIGAGYDLAIAAPERQFFYMPLMHAEDEAIQDRCVRLVAERLPEEIGTLPHAEAHRDLIRRFGRFPHRNAALGRPSTAQEAAFLAEGGYQPGARPAASAEDEAETDADSGA